MPLGPILHVGQVGQGVWRCCRKFGSDHFMHGWITCLGLSRIKMPKTRKIMHREAICLLPLLHTKFFKITAGWLEMTFHISTMVSYTKVSSGLDTLATARITQLWNFLEGSDHEITLGHFCKILCLLGGSRSGNRPLNRSLTTVDESEFVYSRIMKLRCSAMNCGIT